MTSITTSRKFMQTAAGLVPVNDIALAVIAKMPEAERPVVLNETHPDVIAQLAANFTAAAVEQAQALFNAARQAVAKSAHYLQSARWPVQLAAAQSVAAIGENASAFDLQQIELEARLRGRGETAQQLAAKVLTNSAVFTLSGALIDGIETATLDQIRAYPGDDPAAVRAILAAAVQTANAEFAAALSAGLGSEQAQAMADQLFPLPAAAGA